MLGEQGADGVGDLLPSAVADGEVHRGARPVAGVLLRLLEDGDRLRRQDLRRAHRPHLPPASRAGQVDGDVLDDLQQRAELALGPAQVVRGEHEQRDHRDARVVAPAQQVDDLVGTAPVPVGDVLQADGPRPAPVAVHDHADVAGDVGALERAGQAPFVDHGEHIADLLARPHGGHPRPPRRAPAGRRSERRRTGTPSARAKSQALRGDAQPTAP